MGTPMLQENWATILEPGLRAIWFGRLTDNAGGDGVSALYNVVTSSKAEERTLGAGALADVPKYDGTIEYDSYDPLYDKRFRHEEYAKGLEIERKLVDDDLYNIINQRTSQFGLTFGRTRRKHRADTFNNSFTSALGSDGKPLVATDHPSSKTRGGAQSNKGTLPLTYDNVIATRQAMLGFKDDRGNLVEAVPDTIIVPVTLEAQAWTIVNSMNRPGTANNDGNFNASLGWKVIVDRHLTDANNWWMVDSGLAKTHLWWFDRVLPEFAVDPKSDFDLKARYRGYMRYSFGADDWRWLYGHEVSA
jgi:phage major head subunit gpT-like protein